jgi:2-iminoacetate synthase ThiH
MTKAIFRRDKKTGEIMAFFPDTLQDGKMECYAHIGQHSQADILYYWKETKPATEEEYKELQRELISVGYDALTIYKRISSIGG